MLQYINTEKALSEFNPQNKIPSNLLTHNTHLSARTFQTADAIRANLVSHIQKFDQVRDPHGFSLFRLPIPGQRTLDDFMEDIKERNHRQYEHLLKRAKDNYSFAQDLKLGIGRYLISVFSSRFKFISVNPYLSQAKFTIENAKDQYTLPVNVDQINFQQEFKEHLLKFCNQQLSINLPNTKPVDLTAQTQVYAPPLNSNRNTILKNNSLFEVITLGGDNFSTPGEDSFSGTIADFYN